MRKIMVIALSVAMVMAFSIPAMAGAISANTVDVDFGAGATYSLSNNVYLDYTSSNYTNPQDYAVGTVHSAGNRTYATTEATSVIWYQTVEKGTVNPVDATAGWTSAQFSDWTAL
jgi:hypothetical protein